MTQLTKYGQSGFLRQHEKMMRGLFNLTVRPPKKIRVEDKTPLEYQLVEHPTKPGHYTAVPF